MPNEYYQEVREIIRKRVRDCVERGDYTSVGLNDIQQIETIKLEEWFISSPFTAQNFRTD